MATSGTLGKPIPTLTAGGVQNLINKLNADCARIQQSGIPKVTKRDATACIMALTSAMGALIDGSAASDALDSKTVDLWAPLLRPLFAQLVTDMVDVPPATPGDDVQGACYYQGGCAPLYQTQCVGLGGCFVPASEGGSCDNPPPPTCPT